jgi:transcriptional regulator with XRE-family HTH domain
MKLGKVIRTYRLMQELTLRELGQEIGIGAATLMRIEKGHEPDGTTLAKVLAWACQPSPTINGARKREKQ